MPRLSGMTRHIEPEIPASRKVGGHEEKHDHMLVPEENERADLPVPVQPLLALESLPFEQIGCSCTRGNARADDGVDVGGLVDDVRA